jgi:hypothetical protein
MITVYPSIEDDFQRSEWYDKFMKASPLLEYKYG